eukprot:5040068-Prymnesium_polylepis.1
MISAAGHEVTDEGLRTCALYAVRIDMGNSTVSERASLNSLLSLTAEQDVWIRGILDPQASGTSMSHVYDYDPHIEMSNYNTWRALVRTVDEQDELLTAVEDHVQRDEQLLLFVDAPGGCGKTFCFNTILAYLRANDVVVLAIATTGIAALHL